MIKKVGFGLVALVLILVCVTLTQPKEYSVKETVLISANKAVVLPLITDFKGWRKWSPWFERDQTMELKYSEPASGRGASLFWNSKTEGSGKQTITDIVDDEFIKLRIDFKTPYEGSAFSFFKLKEVSENETEVTWLFENENKGFMDKFFYFIFNVKSIITKDYIKGLGNLKKAAESN